MTYIELDKVKQAVRAFRTDKSVYASGDVLQRMRDKIAEEMAVIGYTYLDQRGKTIEELFVEKVREMLFDAQRKDFNKESYVRMSDLNNVLNKILLTSIYD